ncbi:MAG: helix-turn-helix transcriptional regulator [Candidatus Heimdallarchaeota archaeon]|nr:helix-turn-helix transcriptional regulator [Candidatus Heimdallarchaeota archaeon]
MAKKEDKKYKDYLDYESPTIKFLDGEQTKLAEEQIIIIKALRINKNMTAKEIHDLYIDEETKKHRYTIKTIYRYLEKLEEAGLVKISGHRMTEGKRLSEQLYTRTGNIFFKAKKEEVYPDVKEKKKSFHKKIYTVLQEISDSPLIEFNDFENLLSQKSDLEQEFNKSVVEVISENKVLTELYSEMDIDEVNYINDLVSLLLVIIKKPELIKKIQKIYKE